MTSFLKVVKNLGILSGLALMILSFQNCGVQAPKAPDQSSLSSQISLHENPQVSKMTCLSCHEANRKTSTHPVEAGGVAGQDCKGCHSSSGLCWNPTNSATCKSMDHNSAAVLASDCKSCHEKDRKNSSHNPGQDCKGCHKAGKSWSQYY